MKKILSTFIFLCFIIAFSAKNVKAETVKVVDEMKAVWITTVYNQDWPSKSAVNNVNMQKQEFIKILDDIKSIGLNTVMVQVRPKGDALYRSNINPWSDVLTGVQGKDPGYDPLRFIIDEAHKRGIKVHAWLNPYRITTSGTNLESLDPNHFARKNPHTVLTADNSLVYNPGLPEVVDHIVNTVAEIVSNYNVDGVHFDDYFYPSSNVNDSDAYNQYGEGKDIGDFRRNSVNKMVEAVYRKVKELNRSVEFGISPRGIWKNKSSDPTGSETSGGQSYYDIYADTRTWIKNQWLDYVVPQIYWKIGERAADYSKLVPWWSNEVQGTNVKLYIGQGIYKEEVAREIKSQIEVNRKYSNVRGSVYFSYRDIRNNLEGVRHSLSILYTRNDIDFFVTSIYRLALNREPDISGFNYWTTRLADRVYSGRYILRNLLNEPEFKGMKLTSDQFISKMYHIVAAREAEASGLQYWIKMYDELLGSGKTQGEARLLILERMIGEPEFKNRCESMKILY